MKAFYTQHLVLGFTKNILAIVFLFAGTLSYAQTTYNFNDLGGADYNLCLGTTPFTYQDFKFTTNGGIDDGMDYWPNYGESSSGGIALVASNAGDITVLIVKRTDSQSFSFKGIWLYNDIGNASITIKGYLGGNPTGDQEAFSISSEITKAYDWVVDEIRIEGADLCFFFDNFKFESAVINSPPTATAPSAPSVTEDDTNVALADDIQVADTDGDDQTVTFTITGGTLTIGTTGITFGGTGNGNASFTATGTLAAINTALDAATFTPTPNLSGTNAGTIAFISNDGTDDSSPTSVSFDITAVNDDPSVSGLPTDITVSEDIASNVDLSAATLSDVDAGSNSIVLTIEASAGTLTAGSGGSVTIGGSGTATLSLTGSVANIDTYLNTSSNIKYTSASNVNGSDAATLTLTANDGGYTGSGGGTNVPLGTVNVDITAVNDKPTASSFTTSTIYENTTYAFATANFGYSDDDGDPLDHVRITAVPANGSLWVDADGSGTINGAESALSNNGTVSKADLDAGKLKYLNTNGTSSSFTFDVSDGTDYSTSTYTATLTVTPEPTVTLSLDPSSSISENAGSTSVKATLSNTFNKTVSVNLLKSGTTSGTDYSLSSTSISITTGNTTGTATITGVNDDLDEDNETVIIDISSVTNGTESGTQQVICTLTDDDNTPVVTASQSFSIAENTANSGAVGTVLATDVDAGTSFSSWTETGGTGASIFEINASSGAITVTDNSGIDYETTTSYTYIVTVSDGTNTSASETITINITDVNDVTPVVTASQSFGIAENIANSGVVGTVLATDGDAGTSFSAWTETGGTGASIFEINASSGAITVTDNSGIDYETTTSYTYTVTVSDGINTSAAETITINITDVNDVAPIVTASQTFNIDEDASNTTSVGTVLATDSDATATTFSSWTITAGNTNSVFAINSSTGEITVNDANELDYESITSYSLSITVSDGVNTSVTETVTVDVNAINDNTPVVTASQSFDIAENTANSGAVGTVLATDVDAGTSFSAWTETGGTGASIFEINASTGAITVTDNSGIDYETTTSYTYTVTVSDGTNTSATETITINIIDINDNTPVVTSTQSFSIAEDIANSGAVGTVLATDGDAGTSFSAWTETGGSGASIFEINASSGAITVTDNSGIDYETTTSYTYTVTVSDGINTSAAETITINITDVNDVAPVVTATQSFSIAENTANSGAVGTVLATDGDAGTSFSAWTETGGTGASIFEINASSGAITVTDNSGIDYETTTSYTYTVTVSDGINTSTAETITINITDVNDVAPIVTASQTFNIDEDASNTTSVGTVLATDSDATATTFSSWTITAGNTDGIFAVNSTTGEITVTDNTNLDYETTTSYSLTVTVSDGTHTSSAEIVIININDSNENAPTAIQLSNTTIAENSAIGTEVGILTASDADIDETFTFNLAENEYFELDGDRIVSKEIFNYEDYISYSLKVTVTDQGGLSYNDRFTINIENQNETPEFLSEPIVQATVGDMYVYNMEYEDVDEDGCIISVIEKPDWLSVEDHGNGSCTLSGIPTEIGKFNVILEASDDEFSVKQEFEITVETVTGIDDVPKKLSVRVYPNPVIHELHIDLSDFRNDETTISLFSMTGSLIFKEEHKNIGGEVRIIKSVEQLRSGAYFLVIESEGYRKSYKIVKQ